MKKLMNLLAVCMVVMLNTQCTTENPERTTETGVTILVDVTDSTVYKHIRDDFESNLELFFNHTGLGQLEPGEGLTIKMAPISADGNLTVKQASIALSNNVRNYSYSEQEAQRDPREILSMMASELNNYGVLCKDPEQKKSPVLDVILKALKEMNPNNREILMVFTDGFENSAYLNMYKSIPTTEDKVMAVIDKIDPILLKDAKTAISAARPEILFVLKSQNDKKGEVKTFYTELCRQLGIAKISFIDNMSNTVNL